MLIPNHVLNRGVAAFYGLDEGTEVRDMGHSRERLAIALGVIVNALSERDRKRLLSSRRTRIRDVDLIAAVQAHGARMQRSVDGT